MPMLAIVFFGVFQHEVAQPQLRRLIDTAKHEAGDGCVTLCNASGLFACAAALDSQIEMLFESGIDLVFPGEQAVARNAGRSALFSGRWPLVRPLNLSEAAPGNGAQLIDTAIGPFWMVSIADGSGKSQVAPAHSTLESFFCNKNDSWPVLINVSGINQDYKKALSWKYSRANAPIAWIGCGSGFAAGKAEIDSSGSFFVADVGVVASENTIDGVAADIWWKRKVEKVPVSPVPGWGSWCCDYTIIWFDSKGKAQRYQQQSIKV